MSKREGSEYYSSLGSNWKNGIVINWNGKRWLGDEDPSLACFVITVVFKFFWLGHTECEILVPPPGIELSSPGLEERSLYHWTTREIPDLSFKMSVSHPSWTKHLFLFPTPLEVNSLDEVMRVGPCSDRMMTLLQEEDFSPFPSISLFLPLFLSLSKR